MWRKASDGYRTCEGCLDRLTALLAEISDRYSMLSPAPGHRGGDGTPGRPGFGSRSPASDHIIVMMDPRSATGDNARTWRGADGRLHRESERPPLSIFSVLDTIAWDVAEARGYQSGHKQLSVQGLCLWLDGHLDWLTRREDVVALHETLRILVNQLRPATGEKRIWIANCPNTIDRGEHTETCGNRLYAPTGRDDTIRCGRADCGRTWPRAEWVQLGQIAQDKRLSA
jgi:hypothetical protein